MKHAECDLIKSLMPLSPTNKDVVQHIGDDTAVLKYSTTHYQLLTSDMLTEGVHFTRRMGAVLIGHKALACNISDIAAMGGLPKHAVVSLGLPININQKFVKDLYRGMSKLAKKFGVTIVGGDIVSSPKIIINIALTGLVEKKYCTYRSGAKIGDHIFVTGPLGKSFKSKHHLTFIPRIKEARSLVKKAKPTAMMDISDGVATDLRHILKASNVGAVIDEQKIPRRLKATFKQAMCDGEDFELLFTVPSSKAHLVSRECYYIGEIVSKRSGFKYIDVEGKKRVVTLKGFEHLTSG